MCTTALVLIVRAVKVSGRVGGAKRGRATAVERHDQGARRSTGQVAVETLRAGYGAASSSTTGAELTYTPHRMIRPIERTIFTKMFARRFDELLLRATIVAERGAAREQFALLARHALRADAAKKRMMLDALFPEVFRVVAVVKVELDRVLVEAVVFRVQFDEKLFAFEAELANFRPRERVYFGEILKHQYAHVSHGQV